jgi:hypothetical protein
MRKIHRYFPASFVAVFLTTVLLATPVFSSSSSPAIVSAQGSIQYPSSGSFVMKCANTPVNVFKPGTRSYQANAEQILREDLGLNTIRLTNGGEGGVWGTNMINNANWASNFEALLDAVCVNGLKAYYQSLSNGYGCEFGIREPFVSNPMPIDEALLCIEKLAGDTSDSTYGSETIHGNNLGKNFIQDLRIPMWSVANEVDFSNSWNVQWVLAVCDRIKSYGGKTVVPSPHYGSDWTSNFAWQRSILGEYGDHVDYLEIHMYGDWELEHYYTITQSTPTSQGSYDWNGWKTFMTDQLRSRTVDERGTFPIDHLYLGEFGIWRGYVGTDMSGDSYYTDQDRKNYYTYYLQAIKDAGIVNVAFFTSFEENAYYERNEPDPTHLVGRYGMVAANTEYPIFPEPAGTLLPGAEVIAAEFS